MPQLMESGATILPGSAVKGTIRKALVDAFAFYRFDSVPGSLLQCKEKMKSGNISRLAGELEREVLDYQIGNIQGDPFPMLRVGDATIQLERLGCRLVSNAIQCKSLLRTGQFCHPGIQCL